MKDYQPPMNWKVKDFADSNFKVDARRCVLTNGCYDILHAGHVRFLRRCAEFGQQLVVAINTDDSIRELKGPSRPVNPLADRLEVLHGIGVVNWICPFSGDMAHVIRHLKPHCWIKGGDYTMETLNKEEVAAAKEVGAAIVLLEKFGDYSTTEIARRLKG